MTRMRRTCACGQPSQASNARGEIRRTRKPHTWVVVKNRVPFWVPNLGYPKRDHNFDNHPHACNSLRALRQRIRVMDELKKIMLSVLSPKDPHFQNSSGMSHRQLAGEARRIGPAQWVTTRGRLEAILQYQQRRARLVQCSQIGAL